MTLPASPPISLTEIQDEFLAPRSTHLTDFYAGGAYVVSGTRNGAGNLIPSSGNISVLDFLGASRIIEAFDLTVGTTGGPFPLWGFSSPATLNFGGLTPSSFTPNGEDVDFCYWNTSDGRLWFGMEVPGLANSGWTTMNINGNLFTRASATFANGGGETSWSWAPVANPFGTTPGTHSYVIFT